MERSPLVSVPQQPIQQAQLPTDPPPELEGLSLPHPTPSPGTPAGTKDSASAPPPPQPSYFSFSSLAHSYLWSAITLADQKAGFLFASSSAFLGYLMSDGILRQLRANNPGWPRLTAACALVLLLMSIGLSINVVMPRLGGNSGGLIYFKAIAGR